VHCGGLSYASYRLLPILNECLRHQPDLIVICCGHNEFLESVTYADVLQSSAMTRTSYRFGDHLHTVRAVRNLVTPAADRNQSSDRPLLPTEARALLDFDGGYELFTRANLHREAVVSQFGDNLNRMVAMCRQADVPVMLIVPPANLRDCPPFKSEFGEGVSPSQQQRIRELLAVAAEMKTAPADRIGALQQAVKLDSKFAFSWYRLGQEFLAAGRIEEAAAALQRACDEDVCPLRMTTALRARLDSVRAASDLPTIDAHRLLAQSARDGIPGNRVLVDHVHPSFTGHQQIAIELLKLISDDWSLSDVWPQLQDSSTAAELEKAFADHLQSLDDLYFLRGQRTLEDLKAWAEGRADGPPVPDRLRSRSAAAVR
jgi:lysophospholipase L1-like esterase